jgi:crotonobetainyl-CoA:carnitine CoA-transferase CaiB-like acyl-CoA transferase
VSSWISSRNRGEVIDAFEGADLPVGPINSMSDLADDEHLGARSTLWAALDGKRYRQPARVPRISAKEPEHAPSPQLGADTEAIMRDVLGYSRERIETLGRPGRR